MVSLSNHAVSAARRFMCVLFTRSEGVTVVRPGLIEIRAEVTLAASMR